MSREDFYNLVESEGSLDYVISSYLDVSDINTIQDPEIKNLCLQARPILRRLDEILLKIDQEIGQNMQMELNLDEMPDDYSEHEVLGSGNEE